MSSESATIEQIKARHEVDLMKIPGVEGVALGELRGRAAIVVYVRRRSQSLLRKIPASLEGFPVAIEVSGRFVAR